ncbi:hypothetical protein [Psychrobium sp. 1_MG-2023]|uniref:hypothetical protein n=1 Tax=Psychrobium sp. 1_MG-2023 TaxID=3062624 RepID=UPI000C34DD05|nr:hypothetical protein [Psychrobium sp. 1_MG-2023]MDP2560105.1 hypothetical protein [Psychrobium sp. 1_MG-2023]PKF56921.1 hypothetical protein CW748_07435 [Alteromonadales bacterium alter-6D02]
MKHSKALNSLPSVAGTQTQRGFAIMKLLLSLLFCFSFPVASTTIACTENAERKMIKTGATIVVERYSFGQWYYIKVPAKIDDFKLGDLVLLVGDYSMPEVWIPLRVNVIDDAKSFRASVFYKELPKNMTILAAYGGQCNGVTIHQKLDTHKSIN